MKKIWILGISLSLAMLSACSSDSHSPSGPESGNSSSSISMSDIDNILNGSSSAGTVVDEDGFKRSTCDIQSGENVLEALDKVNRKSIRMYEAFSKKNMEDVKALSAEIKPMYKKILDKDPKNCNAQLGYAMASIVNLVNNETLRGLYDDYEAWYNYGIESLEDFTNMITALSKKKSFTKTAQSALEKEILPTVDSAITYMQYIMAQGDYVLNIWDGDYIRELDNSEFGLALGGLFATKAAITIATSMNLEIDDNGSYAWINNLDGLSVGREEPSAKQQKALVKIVNLIGLNGTFTTIYTDKKKAWNSVPNLVDSALTQVRGAFQYSLNETRSSQENDIYVVGKGADADISTRDIKDVIANLDKGLEATRGAYEVEFEGKTFKVNARKYFENVEGIQKFLPYYKFDGSDLETFYFTDKSGNNTESLMSFLDGTLSFPDDGEGVIIFRDPTFGGVFPEFKQKDVWELIDKLKDSNFWDRDDEDSAVGVSESYCYAYDDNYNTYSSYEECEEHTETYCYVTCY